MDFHAFLIPPARRITGNMSDPLFHPSTTHIEVRCWQCGHSVTLRPQHVPDGLTELDFCARAKCSKCGVGQPEVIRYPLPKSRWGH